MYKCILCAKEVNNLKNHLMVKHEINVQNNKEAINNFAYKSFDISNCERYPHPKGGSFKRFNDLDIDNLYFSKDSDLNNVSQEDLLKLLEHIHFLDRYNTSYNETITNFRPFVKRIVNKIKLTKADDQINYFNEMSKLAKYHNICGVGIIVFEIFWEFEVSEKLTEIMIEFLDVFKSPNYFDNCIEYLKIGGKLTLIPLIKKAKNCELNHTQYSGVFEVLNAKFGDMGKKWLKIFRSIIGGIIKNNYSVEGIFWEMIIESLYENWGVIIKNSINNEKSLRKEIFLVINRLLN